ncbi:four helix bundle protein [Fodinibius roseus]|uniref:Four helix bundle protein n=1 Tax=Fodinibius roseus TaxID=1194090 RepID=A0A1M4VUZ6_9BACT|nr:four helix bundle protein [Fodinibius roseus]SHE72806.1 four helix bundle protein [Fodinibius roseus]
MEKTYAFAVRIVQLHQSLAKEHQEYILSNQILKSGTSIGANAEEAVGAESKNDFKSKLSIAYKEGRETHYWLRLLRDTGFLNSHLAASLLSDCNEILKIIGSIIKTLKKSYFLILNS